ncbi:MAG: alanine dehydrogenase [Planctomycetota bacterium]
MIIGVPKEIKNSEHRVGMVPGGAHALVASGHTVLVQRGAGLGSGITDDEFVDAGAKIVDSASAVYGEAYMIVKVKEPLPDEYGLIRKGQTVFTYFHFAASRELTEAMMKSGGTCIAYETIEGKNSTLPLLTPMSEVAGRMSIQVGAACLERTHGGRGVLLGGVPGVEPAKVVVLGGGVVGSNAALMAAGMGAQVKILDINLDRLRFLSEIMPANVVTLYSSPYTVLQEVKDADLIIGAVLRHGARAPVLVPRSYLQSMKNGSVIVDVAVDQGGCIETCHPTTHDEPTYEVDGVIHYCVANMPGAVSRTSTFGLTNATLPYARRIADQGWQRAAQNDPGMAQGVNIVDGQVTYRAVAEDFDLDYTPLESLL